MSLEFQESRSTDGSPSIESDVDYELAFDNFVARMDEQAKSLPFFKKILRDLEEEGDYKSALASLHEFLRKRGDALDRTMFLDANMREIRHGDFKTEFNNIRRMIDSPGAFLGNGAVAEVFSMKGAYKDQDTCVKVIRNLGMYSKGNTIDREMRFLDRMRNVNVAGVRTPIPYYAFSNIQMKGMVMEQLNAYTLSKVYDGEVSLEDLPQDFANNIKEYFARIKEYVGHMHTLGIYHGDLFLRNLMIGRRTGDLYVIDFGKGRLNEELDKTNAHLPDYAASDMGVLDSEEQKLTEYFQKMKQ